MDLHSKRDALQKEIADTAALRDRAIKAADEATVQIARLEGALGVVLELMRDTLGES